MPKTKEQIQGEVTASLLNQNISILINSLAEANARIQELEEKLAEASKKES